jgi:hypothetical protein
MGALSIILLVISTCQDNRSKPGGPSSPVDGLDASIIYVRLSRTVMKRYVPNTLALILKWLFRRLILTSDVYPANQQVLTEIERHIVRRSAAKEYK